MRPLLGIPLFGLVLVIALWAAVAARLSLDRTALFAHAIQDVETFGASFEEHTVRALRDLDRTALVVKNEFERDGTVNLPGLLRKGLIPTDGFVQVSVTDSSGNIVATTGDFRQTVNIADREHFRVHQGADTGAPYIGRPIVDRITGRTVVTVTRRLNLGDGTFGGIVLTSVDPRYFTDFYQERYLGKQGVLAVVGTDGAFRARRVADKLETTGDASRATVFARARVQPVGTFHARSAIDGIERFFAYRQLRDYPLILVAARAESEVLAEYHERSRLQVAIAGIATVAIIVFFTAGTLLVYRLRRSQQRAKKAEALFRAAADGSLDAFILLRSVRDPSGSVVDFAIAEANPRALALLGLVNKSLRGRRLSAVLRRAGVAEVLDKYVRVLDSGEPLDEQLELRPPHGEHLWLRHQAVCALDGLAVSARDITEHKQREEQQRRQTAFLETLVGNLPVGVMVRSARPDSLGRIVLWNHACEYMYGCKAEDAIGRVFRELVPAEYADRVEHWDRKMLESPMVQEIVNAPIDPPGRGRRYLSFIRAPIFDVEDQVEFIISIVTDVTDEKARDEELRLASKVFETTADAVLVSDAEDRVIMVNEAFTELTGFAAHEVRGRKVQELPFAAGHLGSDEEFGERLKREGRITEELMQHRKDGRTLPCWATASCVLDERGVICNFVRVFSDITELKASQQQLERLANYDTLTGLPNRRLFQDRLELAIRRGHRWHKGAALLFIDLDGFKEVNDTIGHDVGDLLLREVSARLLQSVREVDSVSRLGGDEFTVVIEDALVDDAVSVAQRILQALAEPFLVAGHPLASSASVGIALFPRDGVDATTLLRNADAAMYKAKRAGRNRYALFANTSTEPSSSSATTVDQASA